jgi:hypothetical protein
MSKFQKLDKQGSGTADSTTQFSYKHKNTIT